MKGEPWRLPVLIANHDSPTPSTHLVSSRFQFRLAFRMIRPRSPLFVLFVTVFIDMVGFGIIIPVLPLYAEHFHASPMAIGWLTGIYSGMQIIFTPILGKLSDRFGRRPVLFVSIVGTAIGFAGRKSVGHFTSTGTISPAAPCNMNLAFPSTPVVPNARAAACRPPGCS